MAVVTDVDTDPAHRGVEDRVAHVAGPEVELLPEALHLGNVGLAVLAQVGPVGVDHRRGVEVETVVFFLEDGDDEHHPGFFGEVLHPAGSRAVGDWLGVVEVLVLLHLAEVGAVEKLLEAHHLYALPGGLPGVLDGLFDHRFLVAGPLGLDDGCSDNVRHAGLPVEGPGKLRASTPQPRNHAVPQTYCTSPGCCG